MSVVMAKDVPAVILVFNSDFKMSLDIFANRLEFRLTVVSHGNASISCSFETMPTLAPIFHAQCSKSVTPSPAVERNGRQSFTDAATA